MGKAGGPRKAGEEGWLYLGSSFSETSPGLQTQEDGAGCLLPTPSRPRNACRRSPVLVLTAAVQRTRQGAQSRGAQASPPVLLFPVLSICGETWRPQLSSESLPENIWLSGYGSGVGMGEREDQRQGFWKPLKLLMLGTCRGCSLLNPRSAGMCVWRVLDLHFEMR